MSVIGDVCLVFVTLLYGVFLLLSTTRMNTYILCLFRILSIDLYHVVLSICRRHERNDVLLLYRLSFIFRGGVFQQSLNIIETINITETGDLGDP